MKCTNCKRQFSGLTCACGYCLKCIELKHPTTKFQEVSKSFRDFIKSLKKERKS